MEGSHRAPAPWRGALQKQPKTEIKTEGDTKVRIKKEESDTVEASVDALFSLRVPTSTK
jgi:hypothetical protein